MVHSLEPSQKGGMNPTWGWVKGRGTQPCKINTVGDLNNQSLSELWKHPNEKFHLFVIQMQMPGNSVIHAISHVTYNLNKLSS